MYKILICAVRGELFYVDTDMPNIVDNMAFFNTPKYCRNW